MPFVTTYKFEAEVSLIIFLKNKYMNQLKFERDQRIKITSYPPNLRFLVKNKQLPMIFERVNISFLTYYKTNYLRRINL